MYFLFFCILPKEILMEFPENFYECVFSEEIECDQAPIKYSQFEF